MDGIDAAVLTTDGEGIVVPGAVATFPYDARFRGKLRALLGAARRDADQRDAGGCGPDARDVVREFTLLHADAFRRMCHASAIAAAAIDIIGFHGHTVLHQPELKLTRQIGDGQLLADLTGCPVVEDFRSADVAAGGHGAPFTPLFHAALAHDLRKPLAVLNIGGVANVTWIGPGEDGSEKVIAFDTGPGNALVDDWVRARAGWDCDEDGRLAGVGKADDDRIAVWLEDPYFRTPPPKSLDRNTFSRVLDAVRDFSVEDGAATLAAFTVLAVVAGQGFMPQPPRRWLVCGGGRRNATIMAMLAGRLAVPVDPVEAVGWDGDALEAQAFAYLAVRSVRRLPLSLPTTTGVPVPTTGGILRTPSTGLAKAAAEFRS